MEPSSYLDLATGQVRAILDDHASQVNRIAISLAGNCLASASYDDMVRKWDIAAGRSE